MKFLSIFAIQKFGLFFFFLSSSQFIFSQVGVNTESPKANLDVSIKKDASGAIDNSQFYGLQPPRISRAVLTDNVAPYTSDQTGSIIYVTDVSGGDNMDSRLFVTEIGYYYFDGNYWQKLNNNSGSTVTISAKNGLTKTGNDIALGGSLEGGTEIKTAGYNLSYTGDGKIGIGVTVPDAKLHIVSPTKAKGFKLDDGSQAENYVLASDANGNGSWTNLSSLINSAKPTIIGNIRTATGSQAAKSYTTVVGTNISLTKGLWIVYIGQMITCSAPSSSTNNGWIRFTLTEQNNPNATSVSNLTQNNFEMPATSPTSGGVKRALVSTSTSAMLTQSVYYSFASGAILVNVINTPNADNTLTLYLAFEEIIYTGNIGSGNTFVGNNRENYFFAVPINQ